VDYGHDGSEILSTLFEPLPQDVNERLKEAFVSVGVMSQVCRAKDRISSCPYALSSQEEINNQEQSAWEMMDELYEKNTQQACMRMCIDPNTGFRKRTSFNSTCCDLWKAHPEEFQTRILQHNLMPPGTEFEHLNFLCDLIVEGGSPCMVRYIRFRVKARAVVFVRLCVLRTFDVQGRLARIEHIFTPISGEKMDEILMETPDKVCIFRMKEEDGIPVTANSLIQSHEYDRHEGQISRMVQTETGLRM